MIPATQLRIDIPTDRLDELGHDVLAISTQQHEDQELNETTILWSLSPEMWHFLPRIRAELRDHADCYSSEQNYIKADEDPWDASVVSLRPDVLPGARVVEGNQDKRHCGYCDQRYFVLSATPRFTITLPPPLLVPGLFENEDQKLVIASEDFIEELARHGFERGLSPLPLTVEGDSDRAYFALVSPSLLIEAQPWGSDLATRPCSQCHARASSHVFFRLFERPADAGTASQDWFHELILGPAAPLVSKRVADWIRGPGAAWARKPMRGKPPRFVRRGWDPDDRIIGSLPARFQGVSRDPIEPIRPDEYPQSWPPKGRRRK